MAEKATPEKRVRFKFTSNPSAGTSAGGGGGDGDGAAAPASAPRREPPSSPPRSPSPPEPFTYNFGDGGGGDGAAAAPAPAPQRKPSSSLPRSPSPPKPFTYNPSAASSGGGGGGGGAAQKLSYSDPKDSDGEKPDEFQTRNGWGSLFISDPLVLSMSSSDPQNPPYYIGRQNCEPLTRQKFLSLHHNWQQLLDGKNTYLRPPKNNRVAKSNYVDRVFVTPKPLEEALRCQDSKDSDDENLDEFKTENGWGSLFMSDPEVLSKYSSDPQNLPHYIGRQDCEPLSTQEFFSLHHNWQQLLDGKKTYLRRAVESNYADCVFVTPDSLDEALGCQEPLSHLVHGCAGKPIRQQKFKILCEHYLCFRPMRRDGSQFYRAFLFSYLENLGKMQSSQAEVTRLMECVARSRVNFRRLNWNNAYFSNPEAFFSSVVSEFEHLVNSVANGLNAVELYEISLQEISSSRILSLLRLLTEVHIRTYEADYNRAVASQNQNEKINALLFCKESVRPFDADVTLLQMKALSQALGIPLHLAAVDGVKIGATVQVKCIDIIPRSGPLSSTRRYYLSSATDKQSFLPPGNLFSSDRMPLVTILITPNATAILYRK